MPTIPNNAPPIMIANMTYNVGKPTAPPRIRGPIILPSTCCRIRIKIENSNALNGSTNNRIRILGTAPKNGPNTGIIFVTPTTTLISGVYGIFINDRII